MYRCVMNDCEVEKIVDQFSICSHRTFGCIELPPCFNVVALNYVGPDLRVCKYDDVQAITILGVIQLVC